MGSIFVKLASEVFKIVRVDKNEYDNNHKKYDMK